MGNKKKFNLYFKRKIQYNENIKKEEKIDILNYLEVSIYQKSYNDMLCLENFIYNMLRKSDTNMSNILINFYNNKLPEIEKILKKSIDSTIIYTKIKDELKSPSKRSINIETDLFITSINIKKTSIFYIFEFNSIVNDNKRPNSLVKRMIIINENGKKINNSKSIYNTINNFDTIMEEMNNNILLIINNINTISNENITLTKEDILKILEFFINLSLLVHKKLNVTGEKLSYSEKIIMTSRNEILLATIPA